MSKRREVDVRFTPEFKRSLRRLAKRYRSIRQDVEPLIERIASGETPGDRVQGTGHVVYKVRIPNTDARRGKSGGYRVVYYVHSKSDQGDVSVPTLRRIIERE